MLATVVLIASVVLWHLGYIAQMLDDENIRQLSDQLGALGPLLIISLMTLAIVMSPIPSAPIALASGAAYGHIWGAVYVVVGSVLGACVAFSISRMLGRDFVAGKFDRQENSGLLERFANSQNALTAIVFTTRLMPFLSFDVISYAAGLTPLKAWRFVLATFVGVMPASFLLAHYGGELISTEFKHVGHTVLALGAITLLPLSWRALPEKYRNAIAKRLKRLAALY